MRIIVIVALSLALLLGVAAPAAAQSGSGVIIELEAGYEGLYHTSSLFPVVVTISNQGADVAGMLMVGFSIGPPESVGQEIELPRGARKRVLLWLPGNDFGENEVLARLRVDELIVAEARQPVTPVDPSVALVAHVAEDQTGALPDLRQALGRASNLVRLAPAQLPDLDGLLQGLDVIVLGAGELTPAQLAALRRWVSVGGTLLIDGGPDITLPESLGELLPATPGDVIAGAALGQPEIAQARRLTPLPGTRGLPDDASPLWVEQQLGAGVVRLSAVPLQLLPAGGPTTAFWRPSLAAVGQHPGAWSIDLQRLRPALPGLSLPTTAALALFVLAYILLIGPLNYLLLRRLDRREWAWFSIPAGVLLFTLGAYLLGFGLRGATPVLLDVTLVQAIAGESAGQAQATVGLAARRRGSYTISVEGPAVMSGLQGNPWGRNAELFRQEPGGVSAADLQANVGEIRQVHAVLPLAVPFNVQARRTGNGSIEVINHGSEVIERAFLVRGTQYLRVGPLQPGASVPANALELVCCFESSSTANSQSLAELAVFGSQGPNFGFGQTPLPLPDDRWTLVVLSDQSSLPARLDRPAERHSATIYMLYLPVEERP